MLRSRRANSTFAVWIGDLPARRHGRTRVRAEIEDQLVDLPTVGEHGPDVVPEPRVDRDVRSRELGELRACTLDRRVEIDHLRLRVVCAADGEQLLRERRAARGRGSDLVEVVRRSWIGEESRGGILDSPSTSPKSRAIPPARMPTASCRCASRSSRSSRSSSVTSRAVIEEPTRSPFASRIGDTVTSTATCVPSFLTFVVRAKSSSDMPSGSSSSGNRKPMGLPTTSSERQP